MSGPAEDLAVPVPSGGLTGASPEGAAGGAPGDATSDLADDLAAGALALARRFAAGATLWCVSPAWPSHGRHIAVEFVHPVVVGKRALPAIYVDRDDVVDSLRLLARPGDVVVAVSPPGDPRAGAVLRRAGPWGLTSLWLGTGPRPPAGSADHVIWAAGPVAPGSPPGSGGAAGADPALAVWSGDLVRLYHLLWELTHVCLEHPGLLDAASPRGAPGACAGDACVTCSDEGRVAEVVTVESGGRARVRAEGRAETVDVRLVDPLAPGDLVLVHAGVAIARPGEQDELEVPPGPRPGEREP